MKRILILVLVLACIAYAAWRLIDHTAQTIRQHESAQLSALAGGDA